MRVPADPCRHSRHQPRPNTRVSPPGPALRYRRGHGRTRSVSVAGWRLRGHARAQRGAAPDPRGHRDPDPGLGRPAGDRARARALDGPDRRGRPAAVGDRRPDRAGAQPERSDPVGAERRDPRLALRGGGPGRRACDPPRRLRLDRRGDAGAHRRRQRRRDHAGRGRDPVRAGRGPGHDVADGRRGCTLPCRRRGGRGRDGLPRVLPQVRPARAWVATTRPSCAPRTGR